MSKLQRAKQIYYDNLNVWQVSKDYHKYIVELEKIENMWNAIKDFAKTKTTKDGYLDKMIKEIEESNE